jgi:hypothetical protein
MNKHAQNFHDMLTHTKRSPVNFHNAPAIITEDVAMKVFEISGTCPTN